MAEPTDTERTAIEDTQLWMTRAVVGLNLCPFAKAVAAKGQVRYVVCDSSDPADCLAMLRDELLYLANAPVDEVDTTLLIAPFLLPDFLDFNDFLDMADSLLENLDLQGELQIADFHPRYQFAGTEPDDMANHSNRAPYPTLHLLREDSIDKAVQACPDASQIYERNIELLDKLGAEGWQALGIKARVCE